ncbi:hypothetical protein [Nocardiopsis sp. HUAS JQ3]|uniref:hypothetical protein n=1 Tax=Nocardiopsis sp. HUAS JQ3 TaxID=3061629 RepID=UPI0023A92151|nr:hypothetical protein [Nocardiopsis sp. HUAS JQ3]WDZ92699.1 hypothetical protein PV789_09315 [Nocardiopsis sp. HUAS JQ3]
MDLSSRVLLIDASPLLYAARIDRLDVLGSLLKGYECLTTHSVIEEVERNEEDSEVLRRVVSASWLGRARTDSLAYHGRFLAWSQWLKMTHEHNIGETTLCTYADAHGGTVYMDDKPARKVAERRGLAVRGTAGLVADACCAGTWTVTSASSFMDDLIEAELRLPFHKGGFETWAVRQGLLSPAHGRVHR